MSPPIDDTRGYLPYLRALILLGIEARWQVLNYHPAALLRHAGFTVDEVTELLGMKRPAVVKAISRARRK